MKSEMLRIRLKKVLVHVGALITMFAAGYGFMAIIIQLFRG